MTRFLSARTGLVAITVASALGLAASCTIDTDGLVFQDGPATGDGGSGSGGDSSVGEGGLGGDSGGGDPTTCEHASMRCSGKQVEICAGGEWYPVGGQCEFACVSGLCVGNCDPGSTQCVSSTLQQTCSNTGMWGTEQECEFACVDGACGGVCEPGAMDCDDKMPQRCDDAGQWQDQREAPCADACAEGACTTCEGGETQCASSTHEQTCDGENWNDPEPCEFVCLGVTCGGECVPGSTECSSSTHRKVCSPSGLWLTPSACPYACVGTGPGSTCGGVCKPGATRCHTNGTTVQECNSSGQWANTEACADKGLVCATVKSESFCAVCQPNLTRCQNTAVETCDEKGTGWSRPEACGREQVCYKGACSSSSLCKETPTAQGCRDDDTRWLCSEGKVVDEACDRFQTCIDGRCTGGLTF